MLEPGEELEDGVAEAQHVAVVQRALRDALVVDVAAVGRAEIFQRPVADLLAQPRVLPRYPVFFDGDVEVGQAAHDVLGTTQGEAAPQVRPRRIQLHQDGLRLLAQAPGQDRRLQGHRLIVATHAPR